MSKTSKNKLKLKKIDFVKPLYRKCPIKFKAKTNFGRVQNLSGYDIRVKRNVLKESNEDSKSVYYVKIDKDDTKTCLLPGSCFDNKSETRVPIVVRKLNSVRTNIMLGKEGSSKDNEKIENMFSEIRRNGECDKVVQVDSQDTYTIPTTWLRFYPAAKQPGESVCSVICRCVACQLGIITFLVLWTISWCFIISYTEAPYEQMVSADFRRKQNQLVIDLATELRQITPVSPRWREAIERRIENERELTISAVGRGARVEPGSYWTVEGTFLFTVYVMTALGFGAPVPQTTYGRCSSIVYAVLAVPAHVVLMVNASTCIVAKIDTCIRRNGRKGHELEKVQNSRSVRSNTDPLDPNGLASKTKVGSCCCKLLCFAQGIPALTVVYYIIGAAIFGIARGREPLDVIMFPLEFTTSGGLEVVTGYVRLLYGLYVEGAMVALSCMLASARRRCVCGLRSVTDHDQLIITVERPD